MACFSPLQGYRSRLPTKSGKYPIVFSPTTGYVDLPMVVPCGQCIGCRLERSRQWAVRCVHEAQLHDRNCFITLTYSPENLPPGGTLVLKDFQDFMKRLRKRLVKEFYKKRLSRFIGRFSRKLLIKYAQLKCPKIRFYHCGEYGSKTGRPHYHAILFGVDFADKYPHKVQANGTTLYRSKTLEELWTYGHSSIGNVTFESAAYVARYIMKKVNGDLANDHYMTIDDNGEVFTIKPEYTTMSRRPGIAKAWFDKFGADVYIKDEVVMRNGKKMRPPRFYDNQYELLYPDDYQSLKFDRKRNASKFASDNTVERLRVRETCVKAKLSLLKRNVDSES